MIRDCSRIGKAGDPVLNDSPPFHHPMTADLLGDTSRDVHLLNHRLNDVAVTRFDFRCADFLCHLEDDSSILALGKGQAVHAGGWWPVSRRSQPRPVWTPRNASYWRWWAVSNRSKKPLYPVRIQSAKNSASSAFSDPLEKGLFLSLFALLSIPLSRAFLGLSIRKLRVRPPSRSLYFSCLTWAVAVCSRQNPLDQFPVNIG